jgi:drug/metabolite transporter (DMT)-like permease
MTAAPGTRSHAWLFYTLLAIVLWGVWGLVSKAATAPGRMSDATVQVVSTLAVVPTTLLLLASPRWRQGRGKFSVGAAAALGTGLSASVGNLLMLRSMAQGGEASTVLPLTGMFPLVTILLAVLLLHERINMIQYAGIAIAMIALYLFNAPAPAAAAGPTTQAVSAPAGWDKLVSPWMMFAIGALVLWGVAGVLQKIATNHISTELSTALFGLGFIPVAIVLMMIEPVRWRLSATEWTLAILFGALIGIGGLVLFAAYREGKASIVTALYALYPALTVLLAVPIFKEAIDVRKGAAIVLALAAGVALSFETPASPAGGSPAEDAHDAAREAALP